VDQKKKEIQNLRDSLQKSGEVPPIPAVVPKAPSTATTIPLPVTAPTTISAPILLATPVATSTPIPITTSSELNEQSQATARAAPVTTETEATETPDQTVPQITEQPTKKQKVDTLETNKEKDSESLLTPAVDQTVPSSPPEITTMEAQPEQETTPTPMDGNSK
jgi:hypothetical protein